MSLRDERYAPYSDEWYRRALSLAREYAPPIYPCAECLQPVIKGYCCTYCGSTNPDGDE